MTVSLCTARHWRATVICGNKPLNDLFTAEIPNLINRSEQLLVFVLYSSFCTLSGKASIYVLGRGLQPQVIAVAMPQWCPWAGKAPRQGSRRSPLPEAESWRNIAHLIFKF